MRDHPYLSAGRITVAIANKSGLNVIIRDAFGRRLRSVQGILNRAASYLRPEGLWLPPLGPSEK